SRCSRTKRRRPPGGRRVVGASFRSSRGSTVTLVERRGGSIIADPARARKLADRIRHIVAETCERRVNDPRLGFVPITDARITGDLREATVFYTVYGDESDRADTAVALEKATGLIRSEVGRRTGVRHTPSVEFVVDAVPENAQHI